MPPHTPIKTGREDDPRGRQLVIGISILGVLLVVVPLFYLFGKFAPGLLGEWFAVIGGIISTPFLLEIFFLIVGGIIVVGLNHLRQKREGDEFVYLEEVNDPNAPHGLPEKSSYAIYREKPLDGEHPGPAEAIEGILELGEHDEAARMLADLDDAELQAPAILGLRIRLARETGKPELADRLQRQLDSSTAPV